MLLMSCMEKTVVEESSVTSIVLGPRPTNLLRTGGEPLPCKCRDNIFTVFIVLSASAFIVRNMQSGNVCAAAAAEDHFGFNRNNHG